LPDRSLAPADVRAWASFDAHWPWPFSPRRSPQTIAPKGHRIACTNMRKLLHEVCVDAVRDELEGDDEALAYVEELAQTFARKMPGYGVRLEPDEHPDRILWMTPRRAIVLWYDDDAFDRREPFSDWVASLFEDELRSPS
jgi:hypothetical protein